MTVYLKPYALRDLGEIYYFRFSLSPKNVPGNWARIIIRDGEYHLSHTVGGFWTGENIKCSSIEEAKEKLDQILIEKGCVLLTQEQADKLSILI